MNVLLNSACTKSPEGSQPPKPNKNKAIPVTADFVTRKDIPLELATFGVAQAVNRVTICSQLTEKLKEIHFKPGQRINRGDLLFNLETQSFELCLQKAREMLEKDQILAANARREAERNLHLQQKKYAAQEDTEKAQAEAAALLQAVRVDDVEVEIQKLNLANCRIYSPIDGRIGSILIHPGNIVRANDTPLAVINQIRPMDVFFSLPQRELNRIRDFQSKGEMSVEAILPDEPDWPEQGLLTFIDNTVDQSNGSVQFGASFQNRSERLWPGRYVQIRLQLTVQKEALVAPKRAVQSSSTNQYVFKIKEDKSVVMRPVKVTRTYGEYAVIEEGVNPGDQVVTDGHMQLADGVKVEIHEASPTRIANGVTP